MTLTWLYCAACTVVHSGDADLLDEGAEVWPPQLGVRPQREVSELLPGRVVAGDVQGGQPQPRRVLSHCMRNIVRNIIRRKSWSKDVELWVLYVFYQVIFPSRGQETHWPIFKSSKTHKKYPLTISFLKLVVKKPLNLIQFLSINESFDN